MKLNWLPVDLDALPDERGGPFLVTNNRDAVNALGVMSNCWLVSRLHAVKSRFDGNFAAAFSGGEQVIYITHYVPLGAVGVSSLDAVGTWLGFSASVIKSGEPWTQTCQAAIDAARAELAAAQPITPDRVEAALRHAVNFHGLDAKLDVADFALAQMLVGEVCRHLAGRTDVQVYEAMTPEERAKIGIAK